MDAEGSLEPCSESAAAPERNEQVVAEHGWWQHERKDQQRVRGIASGHSRASEPVAGADAEHAGDQRRANRDFERQQQRDQYGRHGIRAKQSRRKRESFLLL